MVHRAIGLGMLVLAFAVMGAAKEPVDLLVTGGTVVTMDDERRIIKNGAVAIRGDRIIAVGQADELADAYEPASRLRADGRLVLPGLINTHTHAPMSMFRGAADDVVLEVWLRDIIFPLEAKLATAELVYWGTKLAAWEMLLGGTTTFTDMYYHEDEVARAASEAGMRVVAGQTILDFPAPDHPTPAEALRYTEGFIERWRDHPLVVAAVAPHSAYTCSAETLKASTELARRTGAPLLIHVAESPGEMKTVKERTGTTSAQYLAEQGVFDVPTLAAHCIYVDEADRALLVEKGVGCAHNPSSNMKLSSGVSPVPELRAAGVPVGLGTDGPAGSNNDFNLMEEMDLAAKLHKVTTMDPEVLPAPEALAMATIEGARALRMDKEIGSLEPGKRADLILLRRDAPHALPALGIYSSIVYSLKASDVETVIINGRLVVAEGRVLTLDEEEIREKAEEYATAVRAVLKRKP